MAAAGWWVVRRGTGLVSRLTPVIGHPGVFCYPDMLVVASLPGAHPSSACARRRGRARRLYGKGVERGDRVGVASSDLRKCLPERRYPAAGVGRAPPHGWRCGHRYAGADHRLDRLERARRPVLILARVTPPAKQSHGKRVTRPQGNGLAARRMVPDQEPRASLGRSVRTSEPVWTPADERAVRPAAAARVPRRSTRRSGCRPE
jgi:hypothetical protein